MEIIQPYTTNYPPKTSIPFSQTVTIIAKHNNFLFQYINKHYFDNLLYPIISQCLFLSKWKYKINKAYNLKKCSKLQFKLF